MNGTFHKRAKKDYWNDPIMAAKRKAYKNVYIPKSLRNKIKIYVKKNGEVAIKNIENMKIITGKDLRKLGFKKQVELPTLDPEDHGYHYYTYEITEECLLISCSNDEKINDGYLVEFYEIYQPRISDLKDLKILIKILERANGRK
jgi:hypothetical protein